MASEVNGILVAAHELKAPLSLMRQLTLALKATDDVAVQERFCDQLVNVSERAMKQINDLAKIARLEDGIFQMEPVGVRGVCETVARDVGEIFGYERKELMIKYHNRERLVIANRELLYSVIYNFCTNALRYSDAETTSVMTVSEHERQVRVSVRDYGPALPTGVWREMQQGALRAPTAIARRPGSSGLGLYIASQFAGYMHARLGAVRHRDGTSFFVELPVSQQGCLF